jgi:hypothetical protein
MVKPTITKCSGLVEAVGVGRTHWSARWLSHILPNEVYLLLYRCWHRSAQVVEPFLHFLPSTYSVLVAAVGAGIKVHSVFAISYQVHSGWVIPYQEQSPASSCRCWHVVESYRTKNRVLVAAVDADMEVHRGWLISYRVQNLGSRCVGAGIWSAQWLSHIVPRTESR